MTHPKLTIRDLTIRSVVVPLKRPLVTRVVTIERAPFLLLDLHSEEGVTGRTYLFGYIPRGNVHLAGLLRDILALTKGDRIAPVVLHAKATKGLTLMDHEGLDEIVCKADIVPRRYTNDRARINLQAFISDP